MLQPSADRAQLVRCSQVPRSCQRVTIPCRCLRHATVWQVWPGMAVVGMWYANLWFGQWQPLMPIRGLFHDGFMYQQKKFLHKGHWSTIQHYPVIYNIAFLNIIIFFRSTRQTIYFSAPFSLFFMAKRSYVFLFLDHVYRARLQNRRLGKLGEPLAIPRPKFNQCAVTPRSKLQQVDTEGRLWLPSGYD